MDNYKQYRRSQIAELADWTPDFDMAGVSISDVDKANGSPKAGDKIARNPKNHADRWLVAAEYFAANFEPADALPTAHEATQAEIRTLVELADNRLAAYTKAQAEIVALDAQRMRMAEGLKEIIDWNCDTTNLQAAHMKMIAVRAFTKPLDAAIDAARRKA